MLTIDALTMELLRLGDYDYVEKMYDKYDLLQYDRIPPIIWRKVAKKFENKIRKINKELKKKEVKPSKEDLWWNEEC